MSQQNRISASLTQQEKDLAIAAFENAKSQLAAILVHSLTPAERKTMIKMGDKTVAFVQKALDYAKSNPEVVPAYLDIAEAERDLKLAKDLKTIHNISKKIGVSIEDAMMICGSEAYNVALLVYKGVQGAARGNVPGSQAILNDLKTRFPQRGGRKPPPPDKSEG
ncbi:hypothetical protein [Foetidibacter luteolus]|uniref:hypothetical protein n=1 Tax=Foetidibacter luteolus TaxID=2608880 RepID=UPI00129BA4E6|nr:hypothetical protein [Foetidibacter luteolus]